MTSESLEKITNREYAAGFVTDIEQETLPPGLSEETVRPEERRVATRLEPCDRPILRDAAFGGSLE